MKINFGFTVAERQRVRVCARACKYVCVCVCMCAHTCVLGFQPVDALCQQLSLDVSMSSIG